MSQSAIEARLTKLLAMADHTATNPHEAANAAAMAAAMAAQHGIDLEELRRKTGDGGTRPVHELSTWHFRRVHADAVWIISVWSGRLFGTVPMFFDVPESSTSKVAFFGKPHAVKLTHSWVDYIWRNCLEANTAHAREQEYGSSAAREEARGHFRKAYCIAVGSRLREKWESMHTQSVQQSDGRSIVLVHHLTQELSEAQQFLNSLKLGEKIKPLDDWDGNHRAAEAAWEAGRKLGLEDQIR